MKIRPARIETDLPVIVRLTNPFDTNPVTVDQVRSSFQYNPPERIQLRLVACLPSAVGADENDAVAGYACILHEPSAPADRFYIWLVVDPACRRQGIGSALWDAALDFLQGQGATRLESEVLDHDPVSLAFAERHGFTIERHLFHSFLDLAAFDEAPYLPAIAALEAQGIRFCSLADIPDTPETSRRLYDLNVAGVLDIPGVDSLPWDYPGFEQFVLRAPWFRREGQFLVVDGDAWVGMAAVSLSPETHSAYNLYTGVLRAYRGRKIAQALKVIAVRYARQHGAQTISTDNDSLNAPMLAINRKMGYQPQPGKYKLVRWLAKVE